MRPIRTAGEGPPAQRRRFSRNIMSLSESEDKRVSISVSPRQITRPISSREIPKTGRMRSVASPETREIGETRIGIETSERQQIGVENFGLWIV